MAGLLTGGFVIVFPASLNQNKLGLARFKRPPMPLKLKNRRLILVEITPIGSLNQYNIQIREPFHTTLRVSEMTTEILEHMKSALHAELSEWLGSDIPDEGTDDFDTWTSKANEIDGISSFSDVYDCLDQDDQRAKNFFLAISGLMILSLSSDPARHKQVPVACLLQVNQILRLVAL